MRKGMLSITALLVTLWLPTSHGEHAPVTEPTVKQSADFNRIENSLNALMDALTRIGDEKAREEFASAINTSAKKHHGLAQQALANGQAQHAREELDSAMVVVKTAIATLRNRETLVRSLNFENPIDEYHYEQDRFQTYGMLVQLLLKGMKPDPAKQGRMEALVIRADKQEAKASALARQTQYKAAIKAQEQSNRLLLQAIRQGGIYVPG